MANGEEKLLNIVYNKMDDEKRTLNLCDEVGQELKRLNDGIQACLEIAGDSIGNKETRSKIKTLQIENNEKYKIASATVESDIKEHKDAIKQLKSDAERISANNRQKKV
jgi:hypothetical protein